MTIPNTRRTSREWLLLVAALVVVGVVVVPLSQMTGLGRRAAPSSSPSGRRSGSAKLLIGPEQAVCYVCFVWAGLILLERYRGGAAAAAGVRARNCCRPTRAPASCPKTPARSPARWIR